jgi:hypothetical protein
MALLGNLAAEERRGADTVIIKKDGQAVKGELISVKEDPILLLGHPSGTDISVNISEIKAIKIRSSHSSSLFVIPCGDKGSNAEKTNPDR